MTNALTAELTRPIVGIENRTAQEVFDIMSDRIKRASPPSPPVSGEPWGWAVPTVSGNETATRNRVVAEASRFAKPLYTHPLTNEPVGAASRKFNIGERVTKRKGSNWTGKVVGFYSTAHTPIGYAVESETEKGSVQIYPEIALSAAIGELK